MIQTIMGLCAVPCTKINDLPQIDVASIKTPPKSLDIKNSRLIQIDHVKFKVEPFSLK